MASLFPDLWKRDEKGVAPFEHLHDEIDRVFDQFRKNVDLPTFLRPGTNGEGVAMSPRVDVTETGKDIEISMELPGVEEKDIEVTALDNMLVIKAEKKSEKTERDDGTTYISERTYGMFQRSLPIGFDVDPDKVDAKFSNGVLNIKLPKPPELEAKKKKIAIRSDA